MESTERTAATGDAGHQRAPALDRAAWRTFLDEENVRLAATGTRVGIISIEIAGSPGDTERSILLRDRAVRMLSRLVHRTDRVAITSDDSIALLRAPLESLPALERQARNLTLQLHVGGIDTAVGFAHRRTGEDLLDTWARADAQADRAMFRLEHPDGGLNLD